MQDRHEDRALDRKLEAALGQQRRQHRGDAGLGPEPLEDQGPADAPARQPGLGQAKATLDFREAVAFVDNAYRPGDRILDYPGYSYYSRREIQLEPWFGNPYNDGKDWKAVLKPYAASAHRTWIILPIRRGPLAKGLETWLLSNARLVWRRYAKRYDYTFDGYQVFLVDEAPA